MNQSNNNISNQSPTMKIVTFKPQDHFIKALIFWKPGSWKTTFASTAPKPLFLSAEGGLLSIADKSPDAVIIQTLKDLQDAHHYLKTTNHPYKTVVIDSITEINEIVKAEIEKKNGRYIRKDDWGEVLTKIKRIIRDFRDLPMHCIFLAQEAVEKDKEEIIRIYPSLNGKAATEIAAACDIVGYMDIDKTSRERYMVVQEHAILATKNRLEPLKTDNPALDFSKWVELMWKICVGDECVVAQHDAPVEQDPYAPPEFQKPIVQKWIGDKKIDPETVKMVHSSWSTFMETSLKLAEIEKNETNIAGYQPQKSNPLLLATLQKLYIVKWLSDLTEKQALDFITRIDGKVDDIKAKLPKEEKQPSPDPKSEEVVDKPVKTKTKPAKKSTTEETWADAAKNIFQSEETVEIK